MFLILMKAIVVGIAASVPLGPIAILVIQKTLTKGFKAGFVTSMGSTLVDTIFSIVAIFALTFVETFINGNPIPVFVGGGLVVIGLGISMALSNPFRKVGAGSELQQIKTSASVKDFLTASAMGLSNPGAIVALFALMAFFGLENVGDNVDWTCFPVIVGVALGSAAYWLMVTSLLSMFRKKFNMRTIIWCNRVMGIALVIIGLAFVAEGIMKIVL